MDTSHLPPRGVDRDVVESVRALAGYRTHLWAAPFCWTAVAVASAGLTMGALFNLWVAVAVWVLGLMSLFWVLQVQHDWDEHSTSLCNALERRLELPERHRHRQGYPGAYADL